MSSRYQKVYTLTPSTSVLDTRSTTPDVTPALQFAQQLQTNLDEMSVIKTPNHLAGDAEFVKRGYLDPINEAKNKAIEAFQGNNIAEGVQGLRDIKSFMLQSQQQGGVYSQIENNYKTAAEFSKQLEEGLTFIVKSIKGYRSLIQFFREGGIDPWGEKTKDKILMVSPVEQYLISKEKRLFKGFEEYNDITRFVFDLETTSLEPRDGRIFMIGMKTNKGFQKVIECSNEDEERSGIVEFFRTINEIKPSIIAGYNSANFDWFWIFERCKALNLDIKKIIIFIKW